MYKLNESERQQLSNRVDIYNYIHGGRGIVTLESPTGKHHTYLFKKPSEEFPEDVIFVYVMHNKITLYYVGMIENSKFRLTKASRFLPGTETVKGAEYIVNRLANSDKPSRMRLYHEGICCRCGRPLKDNHIGIGKKCLSLLNK